MLRAILTLPSRRLAFKIAGLSVFLVVITIGFFTYQAYRRERWLLQERFGLALERIVATAALGIAGEDHLAIRRPEDTARPEAARIRSFLEQVQVANSLAPEDLQTFHLTADAERLTRAVTLGEGRPVGQSYTLPESTRRAFARALELGRAKHTKLYADEDGVFVSAYSPILTRDGAVAGVLEAHFPVTRFHEAMKERLEALLWSSTSAIGLAILLSVLFALGIARALDRIRAGAQAISRHDYDHRVSVRRKDELGLVADHFNAMADTLRERFFMLKFLPKHTLDAIIRQSRQLAGQRAESTIEATKGSVLFTDIRGYTTLSEEVGPEQIVRMLNTYLRREAEILAEHGGVIDKFIGDAVLGIFMGEDHVRRAVAAGLAIQREVIEMNTRGAFDFPVHVGVGIACGNLVLAEIGSDERRERTPIGSVVNLAARLCAKASADEVLVSDGVREALGGTLTTSTTQNVDLKGFTGPQLCHVAQALAA